MDSIAEIDQNLTLRQKALINEYKGALFEFSVASELSKFYRVENKFYRGLPVYILQRLKVYEKELSSLDSCLVNSIISIAREVAPICAHNEKFKNLAIDNIILTAKEKNTSFGEGDISLCASNGD